MALNDYVCTFVVNKVDVTEKEQQRRKSLRIKQGVEEAAEEVHFDHYLISR